MTMNTPRRRVVQGMVAAAAAGAACLPAATRAQVITAATSPRKQRRT